MCFQLNLSFLIAFIQSALLSSNETPNTVKFLFLNLLNALTTFGFSPRQGPHQEAQKSTRTYCPLKSCKEKGLSSVSFIVKSGAISPTPGLFVAGFC